MIKDTDILKAISKILNTKFGYGIFIGENVQEVKEPSFFISISPLTSDTFKEFNQKVRNAYVIYTNYGVQMEELLDIGNQLDELFGMSLKVEDMVLPIKAKKFNRQEDFITMTLTIDFKDSKETTETAKLMENLNLKTN